MSVHILPRTKVLESSMTIIRNKDSKREDFIFYSNRICHWLIDAAFEFLPFIPKQVISPTESICEGLEPAGKICGVSIMRAGDSMGTIHKSKEKLMLCD